MEVPKHLLQYGDELTAWANSPEPHLTDDVLAKVLEIQGWLVDYYDWAMENPQPLYSGMSSEELDALANDIVARMDR